MNELKERQRGALRKEVRLSYIRLAASYIASQWYYASHSYIALRAVLRVNIISLKPQGFNITLLLGKISLQTRVCNITQPNKKGTLYFRQIFTFLKVCNLLWHFYINCAKCHLFCLGKKRERPLLYEVSLAAVPLFLKIFLKLSFFYHFFTKRGI